MNKVFESDDDCFVILQRKPDNPSDYVVLQTYGTLMESTLGGLAGKTLRDLPVSDGLVGICDQVLKTGEALRFERFASQSNRSLEVSIFRRDAIEQDTITVLIRDISARREAEQSLRDLNRQLEQRVEQALAERRQLASLVENWREEVLAVDTDLRLIACNRLAASAFEASYGKPPQLGAVFHDQVAEWPDVQATAKVLWERALGGEEFVNQFRRLDEGATREAHFRPIRDADGTITGAYLVSHDVTDREAERARHEAAEAERRVLSRIVGTAPVMITAFDPDFRLLAINTVAADAHERNFGMRPKAGDLVSGLMADHPGYAELLMAMMQRAMAGETFSEISVVERLDGPRHIERTCGPLTDDSGAAIGAYQHTVDVTERVAVRQRTRQLEAERAVLADIIDSSPVMMRAVDTDLRFIALNAAAADEFEQSYGVRPKVGDSLTDLLADWPERLEAASQMWRRAFGGESFRIAVQREGVGGMRHIEGTTAPLIDANGRCIGGYQHVYDVTERIVQQQRLSEAEADRQLWADLVDEWNADMLVADKEFRWIAVNRSASDNFERLYGVRPEIGVSMLDQVSHLPQVRDELRALWQRAFDGEEYVDVSTAFRDDEARRRHFEIRFSALKNESGEQIGAYQFVYDVTARISDQERLHEVEDALRQSQKMEAVGQLTGGLAHDFNNLLAAISGSIDMVGARIEQGRPDDAQRYLDAGKTSVKRAADLTHRLLAFSRRQTLSPTAVAVQRLLGDMAELVHRTAGPTFVVETRAPPDLWPIMADAHQLENAVLNLCINARDAMPQGGTIAIDAQNRFLEAGAFGENALAAGDYVAIRVSDSGVGIPGEVIDRVFEPFFTTKSVGQGTGLGLSMVYGFVRQSNGIVRIESRENEGTAVTIFLPRHDGDGALGLTPDEEASDLHGAGDILVVDDEMLVRMMVADGLSDAGFVCAEAGDGAEAMRHIASDARIDLLVSDVGLPGGMNGRELADAARQLRPDLKVLFITGYADKAVLDDIGSLPNTDVMLKPFDIDKLVDKVAGMVTHRQAA